MPTWILSRPDRVGDVIIATACLAPIRRQRPDLRLIFAAREVMRPLLEGHPLLDGFLALPDPAASLPTRWRQSAREIRAREADAIIHLHPDRAAELGGWSARVPRRLGRRHSALDWLTLTHCMPDERRQGRKHEGEFNFDLLAPLGIIAPPGADALRPRVHLPEGEPGLPGCCVLNPTAHSPLLRWPPECFAQLAVDAGGRLGRIVLVAERANDPAVQSIVARLRAAGVDCTDLAGRLDLGGLGRLLRDARVLISRNTGTAHLAAAVGCPVVELFGRREPIYGPGRWRALGRRTAVVSGDPGPRGRRESKRAYWRRGYEVITVREVLDAALALTGAAI